MPRRKKVVGSNRNKVKEVIKTAGASQRLVALMLDVNYTTVSSWNSNITQPNNDNLNEMGELLQVDNRDLLEPQGRINTGLALTLEKELKRLHKEERMEYEIDVFDKRKKKIVKVNNPELVKKLKEYLYRLKNKEIE